MTGMTVTYRPMLAPFQVAQLFGVNPKTVTRWAKAGYIEEAPRTLGGHRRYYEDTVEKLLTESRTPAACPDCGHKVNDTRHYDRCKPERCPDCGHGLDTLKHQLCKVRAS